MGVEYNFTLILGAIGVFVLISVSLYRSSCSSRKNSGPSSRLRFGTAQPFH